MKGELPTTSGHSSQLVSFGKDAEKHLTVTRCAHVHSQMQVNTHIVHTHQNMHSLVQYIHIYTYNAKVHLLQLNILFQYFSV